MARSEIRFEVERSIQSTIADPVAADVDVNEIIVRPTAGAQ